ncbi:MAG: protease modulator HflC [Gammaproteobacteria bacterium]|nr:protease modulator HflC [Gammaproteobacteria bacterium]
MGVKSIVVVVLVVILGALALDSFYVVNEWERALVLQFGKVQREDVQPNLHMKIPIAEEVKRFDGRILTLDSPAQRYFTIEKKPLIVDSFVKWRISDDVQKYYESTSGDELRANNALSDRVNEGLRNQIGRRTMHEVISGERDQLMQELTESLNTVMITEFGVNVIDVRVKRIDLPEEVSSAVFQRMNSEREIEAKQYRAEGSEVAQGIRADAERESIVIEAEAYREAEQIRGDGDALATSIYASAYGQDEEFYDFYRSLNAYQSVFDPSSGSLWVIDPSSEFFKYLTEKK